MTLTQQIITIASIVLGTMLTRFLPFILFPSSKEPPKYIRYLASVLPYAVMGLLIVYCLRDAFFSTYHGIPEFIAIVLITILHRWKKNILLSIGCGTICYMMLIQHLF